MSFNLVDLQEEVINTGRDLLSGSTSDINKQKSNAQIIKDMYWQVRTKKRLNKQILTALNTDNHFVKEAALEIISEFPEKKARDVLFMALEDETDPRLRQKIVHLIDRIESMLDKKNYREINPEVSITSALRMVKVSNHH